jgi:transcription elongation GreA/GreB family factor
MVAIEERHYLATSEEADAANGRISTTSPIGRAFWARKRAMWSR